MLHPSVVAQAHIRGVPLSLARSGKATKRSRDMCGDLIVHDFPNAPANVSVLGSPNHVYGFWQSLQRSVFPNRGSRSAVPSVERLLGPFACPHA